MQIVSFGTSNIFKPNKGTLTAPDPDSAPSGSDSHPFVFAVGLGRYIAMRYFNNQLLIIYR